MATNTDRRIDLHPAECRTPGGFHRRARAVFDLDGGRLRVWAENADRTAVVEVYDGPGSLLERPDVRMVRRRQHLRVLTPDGEYHVNAQVGCGCGSPLKALSP